MEIPSDLEEEYYIPTPQEIYDEWVDELLYEKLFWAKDARCRDLSVTQMYPPYQSQQRQVASNVCSSCPVKVACLGLAIAKDDIDGVWGGFCEADRKQISTKLWDKIDRTSSWDRDKVSSFYEEIRSYSSRQTIPLSSIGLGRSKQIEAEAESV